MTKNKQEESLRTQFLRVYANLPLGIREDIICVLDNEPMSWSVVYLEIKSKTKISWRILDYLKELQLI